MKDGAACLEGRRLEGDESKSERERENAVGKESKIARNRPVIRKGNTHKTKHIVPGLLVDRVHLGLLWPSPPPQKKSASFSYFCVSMRFAPLASLGFTCTPFATLSSLICTVSNYTSTRAHI